MSKVQLELHEIKKRLNSIHQLLDVCYDQARSGTNYRPLLSQILRSCRKTAQNARRIDITYACNSDIYIERISGYRIIPLTDLQVDGAYIRVLLHHRVRDIFEIMNKSHFQPDIYKEIVVMTLNHIKNGLDKASKI